MRLDFDYCKVIINRKLILENGRWIDPPISIGDVCGYIEDQRQYLSIIKDISENFIFTNCNRRLDINCILTQSKFSIKALPDLSIGMEYDGLWYSDYRTLWYKRFGYSSESSKNFKKFKDDQLPINQAFLKRIIEESNKLNRLNFTTKYYE